MIAPPATHPDPQIQPPPPPARPAVAVGPFPRLVVGSPPYRAGWGPPLRGLPPPAPSPRRPPRNAAGGRAGGGGSHVVNHAMTAPCQPWAGSPRMVALDGGQARPPVGLPPHTPPRSGGRGGKAQHKERPIFAEYGGASGIRRARRFLRPRSTASAAACSLPQSSARYRSLRNAVRAAHVPPLAADRRVRRPTAPRPIGEYAARPGAGGDALRTLRSRYVSRRVRARQLRATLAAAAPAAAALLNARGAVGGAGGGRNATDPARATVHPPRPCGPGGLCRSTVRFRRGDVGRARPPRLHGAHQGMGGAGGGENGAHSRDRNERKRTIQVSSPTVNAGPARMI